MANFKQVIKQAMETGKMEMISVNKNMMEVSMATKKKPGFVKVAVTEELAKGLIMSEQVALILYMDGDELNAIAEQIDAESEAIA